MNKLTQIGIVRKVEGHRAEIEIARSSSCGEKCSSCQGGCTGTGFTVVLENGIGAKEGDRVKIESKASNVVYSALFVYLVPVVMMILGMVYGSAFMQKVYPGVNPDIAGLVFGLAALLVFYLLLKTVDRWLARRGNKSLVISDILNK